MLVTGSFEITASILYINLSFNFTLYFVRALESLAAEKGYRFWDSDLRFTDTPLEAALTYTCKLKTSHKFLGREALELQQKAGIRKRIVCLTLET